MKKRDRKYYTILLFCFLFILSACSGIQANSIGEKDSPIIIQDMDVLSVDDILEAHVDTEELIEPEIGVVTKNIETIEHPKDGTTYIVILQVDLIPLAIASPDSVNDPVYKNTKSFSNNYLIRVLDERGNQLQMIPLEYSTVGGIYFEDVNNDDYLDIVVKTGGTMNETHELYIWDSSAQNFIEVIFEGFDMLSFYTVYDGYIDNFLRASTPEESMKMKLIWEGNILKKEYNY